MQCGRQYKQLEYFKKMTKSTSKKSVLKMEPTLFRKNLREQIGLRKNQKASGTGKTLQRKVLMKTVKKQITKHIRELNPTNVLLVSLSESSAFYHIMKVIC